MLWQSPNASIKSRLPWVWFTTHIKDTTIDLNQTGYRSFNSYQDITTTAITVTIVLPIGLLIRNSLESLKSINFKQKSCNKWSSEETEEYYGSNYFIKIHWHLPSDWPENFACNFLNLTQNLISIKFLISIFH